MIDYRQAFNHIADSWYGLRHHSIFNKELNELAQKWQKGVLLNIGCAHGADFVPFKDNFKLTGLDIAQAMQSLLQKYGQKHGFTADFVCADMVSLPFKDSSFDYVIAIASLHHVDSHEGRLQALKEMKRILKKDGQAFITVWNYEQERFKDGLKECLIPYHSGKKEVLRYYYLFEYDEIEQLSKQAGFKIITIKPENNYTKEQQTSRNICLLLSNTEK
ncbi:MAG: class I SAM-dependent methyltransferase [Chloroflexi bacterium]|nr:class I SAM-dependent methyltransferase [Chloroflexota bacterium]